MQTEQFLIHKTILLISPQAWGKMYISKHHYAIELARKGNRVYFLTPLYNGDKKTKRVIIHHTDEKDLFIIEQYFPFPFQLKFHLPKLYYWLINSQLKKIIKAIPHQIDIVWSFDLGNFFPFRFFNPKSLKIFHPVDEPLNKAAFDSAKGADIIFSVTNEILEKYQAIPAPRYFINHGLAEYFLTPTNRKKEDENIRVGFSGNLLVNYLDRETLVKIITENPEIHFQFWGAYEMKQSNIGGADNTDTREFILNLKSWRNVTLCGILHTKQLAEALQSVDAFLMCYDIKKEQSKGTNYHKLMEYFSTGKVVIANNITTYKDRPNLVQMAASRENNFQLPGLFNEVIKNLAYYNRQIFQEERIAFAKENTYKKQILRIEKILDENLK